MMNEAIEFYNLKIQIFSLMKIELSYLLPHFLVNEYIFAIHFASRKHKN